jgi:hypothetical protein
MIHNDTFSGTTAYPGYKLTTTNSVTIAGSIKIYAWDD